MSNLRTQFRQGCVQRRICHGAPHLERVENVSDYLKEGQSVTVKVIETDDKGRIRLSMKALN